ncbi:MAG: hypothetical protein DRI46_12430, partial [Chloroflexi bacterium]
MGQLYTNNASAFLAIAIDDIDTQVIVDAGFGGLFPLTSGPPDFFMVSLENDAGQMEIMKCTSRAGDTMIVERGHEGTLAVAFAVQSRVECRLTAGAMNDLMQKSYPQLLADFDLNGFDIYNGGAILGVPLRGDDGSATKQILVPDAEGDPTIGGEVIWNAGNDGKDSTLNADLLDGLHAAEIIAQAIEHVIPVNTRMLFQQSAAPVGWTKDTSNNDNHGLRVVTGNVGSGGSNNFSNVFKSGKTTSNHTLTISEMPSHNHLNGIADGTNVNFVYGGTGTDMPGQATQSTDTGFEARAKQGKTSTKGDDDGHNHSITMDLKYVDVIIAVKEAAGGPKSTGPIPPQANVENVAIVDLDA